MSGKDRALTASATRSTWSGIVNLTTHTGTTDGVFDANGNVWEYSETVGLESTGKYVINDVTLPVVAPAGIFVSGLSTDPRLRRNGLPGVTSGSAAALFGGDYFWDSSSFNAKNMRGGLWLNGSRAGLWSLRLAAGRLEAGYDMGFRPALRY